MPPLLPCVELREDPEEWCERLPDEWYPPLPRARELIPPSLVFPDPTSPPRRRRLDGLLAYSRSYGLPKSLSAPLLELPPPPLLLCCWRWLLRTRDHPSSWFESFGTLALRWTDKIDTGAWPRSSSRP